MVRTIVLVILSWLVFALGQGKEGTGSIQKAEYLGSWVGDPTVFLERLNFIIFLMEVDYRLCVYGESVTTNFLEKANDCLNRFTSGNETVSLFCAKKGFTHYGIANLRISHSNVIVNAVTHNKYGHFMVVYGDVFCAIRKK